LYTLSRLGYPVAMHFSVYTAGEALRGHSWVTVDGRPVAECLPPEALVRRAQAWGIAPYAYLPLQLTRALWGVGLPEPVFGTLKPAAFDPRLVGRARDERLEAPETSPLPPDLLRLWRGPGVADRVAVLRRLLAPTVIARRYGVPPTSPRRHGDYPARLWHLARRYGPVLWWLVRHDPPSVARAER
jgi:Transglutaminase-like superfamily